MEYYNSYDAVLEVLDEYCERAYSRDDVIRDLEKIIYKLSWKN